MSSVWGHCEVKLRYHGGIDAGVVPRLMDMAKVTIKEYSLSIIVIPVTVVRCREGDKFESLFNATS